MDSDGDLDLFFYMEFGLWRLVEELFASSTVAWAESFPSPYLN